MQDDKPVKFLVVDSSAFIKNAPIKDLTNSVFTTDDVINEIKDATTKASLQVLPYDFKLKNPSTDAIKFISNFSKKTGDYNNLSAVDIQLLALAYQLCKENLKPEEFSCLKTEPISNINKPKVDIDQLKLEKPVNIAGFYVTPKKEDLISELEKKMVENLNVDDIDKKDEIAINDEANLSNNDIEESESNELDLSTKSYDEEAWITPINLEEVKKINQADSGEKSFIDKTIPVGCITSDFSMQNVLIQIGIPVLSVDGLLIKKPRSYVLKCTSCLKVTTDMSKRFCPNCSYKTLERVLVSIDSNGNKVYQERKKKPSLKGLRFSLPMPRGGKHSNFPILSEDQPRPQNFPSKKSLIKNNPLDPDYICQSSPFVTRDIYSRASRLGIRSKK